MGNINTTFSFKKKISILEKEEQKAYSYYIHFHDHLCLKDKITQYEYNKLSRLHRLFREARWKLNVAEHELTLREIYDRERKKFSESFKTKIL